MTCVLQPILFGRRGSNIFTMTRIPGLRSQGMPRGLPPCTMVYHGHPPSCTSSPDLNIWHEHQGRTEGIQDAHMMFNIFPRLKQVSVVVLNDNVLGDWLQRFHS
ncbi:hypothetical protein HPP92_014251 [Vanilla planifolia]|uniref:Uncharacterized protein n=1 Tax=Vanilla planifolia TaxID=51239 RepID=A0A835UW17_VANPL|nr:hypothetical protein HPP92_014251 [Vanilla planifolia]